MMNNVTTYNNGNIRLVIQDRDREQAWNTSQNYSHTLAKYNAYLNQICLQTFKAWFEEWIKNDSNWTSNNKYSAINVSDIRELVNGSILKIGMTKLALIPSNDLDLEEFFVPQEWVDIPTWTADYYLDIRVNLDAEEDTCWMDILGFTTHRQLKFNGTYNKGDKTYSLSSDRLRDLEFLSLTLDLNVKAEISPLPSLELLEAKKYIEELGKRSIYSPRLHLPFEKWGALLENETYRQQLFDLRREQTIQKTESKPSPISLIDLLHDFANRGQKLMDSVWKDPEVLLNEPSLAFRSSGDRVDLESIHELTSELLKTTDEKKRWDRSIKIGKIDPTHPLAGVRKARIVDLGLHFKDCKIALIIAMMPNSFETQKTCVKIEVRTFNKEDRLPPNLKLIILSDANQPHRVIEPRKDSKNRVIDKFWKVPFSLPVGHIFKIQLTLDDLNFTESFLA